MSCDPVWLASPQGRQAVVAVAVRAHRMLGERLGRDLYTVPALDMLLDLYLLNDRKPRSLSSLCGASDTSIRTALRTINRMVDRDLLIRTPDLSDARRTNVELAPKAIVLLDGYFDALCKAIAANRDAQ
jgi:DNA-binding MarR family transcriptional regulator